MKPIVHLPPSARKRQRQEAETADDATDRVRDWHHLMAQRMSDVEFVRLQLRAEVVAVAEHWRQEARTQRRAGNARAELFYSAAADAVEGWSDKVFSVTTVWPGL